MNITTRKTISFSAVAVVAFGLLVWLVQDIIRAQAKRTDEINHDPGHFIRVIEVKDTPEGVRCFAPAFYGEPPSPKSGVTCVVVWEGRVK